MGATKVSPEPFNRHVDMMANRRSCFREKARIETNLPHSKFTERNDRPRYYFRSLRDTPASSVPG
jgi:hypothetical protein